MFKNRYIWSKNLKANLKCKFYHSKLYTLNSIVNKNEHMSNYTKHTLCGTQSIFSQKGPTPKMGGDTLMPAEVGAVFQWSREEFNQY